VQKQCSRIEFGVQQVELAQLKDKNMSLNITRRTAAKAFLATAAGGMMPGMAAKAFAQDSTNLSDEKIKAEVCVIGGGSGGTGAALAAARAGAKVVLLERESILGGTATCAFVNIWRPVTGGYGIPFELFKALVEYPLGVTLPPDISPDAHYARSQLGPRHIDGKNIVRGSDVCFEPRAMDYVVRSLLDATGCCQTLLATTFCRAHVENDAVKAVEAWFSGKRLLVEADVFIDCTADGDVCVDAGCEYHMGEDPKSRYNEPRAPEQAEMLLNGLTLCYRITDTGVKQKPRLPKGVKEKSCPIGACFDRMPNGDIVVNAVGMIGGNAILCMEHSELMQEAQRRVLAHMHAIQQLPPDDRWATATGGQGWGTWAISAIAPRIGVRETRRIVTEYVLTENDWIEGVARQKHKDIVAIADHTLDIHGRASRLPTPFPLGPFGVPYRCLLPKGMKNLMVASRAAGFSHIASSAVRLQRTLITLGQAAGNAAAIASKQRIGVQQVDIAQLQEKLVAQGVDIVARPEQSGSGS
jgi:hypothetical protein